MSEIVQAWLYTSDNNMGILDCHFDAKAFIEGTITDAEAAAHCDDNASSASPAPYGDILVPISQVDDITAHHIWVGFFLQTWQVCSALLPHLCCGAGQGGCGCGPQEAHVCVGICCSQHYEGTQQRIRM